jgi:hypothetical protein
MWLRRRQVSHQHGCEIAPVCCRLRVCAPNRDLVALKVGSVNHDAQRQAVIESQCGVGSHRVNSSAAPVTVAGRRPGSAVP